MRKLSLLLLLLFNVTIINAQTIKGKVVDLENNSITYATVILYQLPDTAYVKGVTTDDKGLFEINCDDKDNLLLGVTFFGYKNLYCPAIDNQTIVMEVEAVGIDEVVVKGNRPISKITASGIETTVENTLLSDVGTGDDLLKRIPMVKGDNGEYEVFGRGAARIYINNREVRDPAELDNLNSSDIATVEVISNPGARYDATVAAVINIKTIKKEGDGLGFNLRSSFHASQNQDYINQINTNYRKGGLDIFANIYHSDITYLQYGDLDQITDIGTIWQQNSYIYGDSRTVKVNGTVGLNYEINNDHYVGVRYDHKTTPKDYADMFMLSEVLKDGELYDNWNNNEMKTFDADPTSELNLYYSGKIGKLSVDFNGDYNSSNSLSDNLNTEISDVDGTSYINSSSDINNKLLAAKLQLSYPIWKGRFSAGGEYVDITRNDNYLSDIDGFSSKTDVAEQNLAIFAQYDASTNIGNFSVGIRYEDAGYNYLIDDIKDDDLSRDYGEWFPNASYSNSVGSVNLQLSYSSKVVRPTYTELSNTMTYGNSMTIQTGNPYLKPSIINELSLAAVWQKLQMQVSYRDQRDYILMWTDRYEKDPKVSLINYKNIDRLPKITAVLAYAPTIGLWNPQVTIVTQKQWLDLAPYGVDVTMNKPIYFLNFNNLFELPYDFVVNLDANYLSTGNADAAYLPEHELKINAGVTKTFFDKALSLKLQFSDITNQSQSVLFVMPQSVMTNLYHFDNREVSITVRYNFNSANSKYKGSGAGNEAKRRF